MSRAWVGVAVLAATSAARADFTYTVKPDPQAGRVLIKIDVPTKGSETVVQMPRWSPGAYVLRNPPKDLEVTAVDDDGVTIKVTRVDDATWKVASPRGSVHFSYAIGAPFSDGTMHYSGPSTYLYVVGRKDERCVLKMDLPSDWQLAVGLDETKRDSKIFAAKNYDVLADNPVSMGHFLEDHYTSFGKDHTIALRNAPKDKVDRQKLIKATKFVSDMQGDFFGGLPYNKYVWHFSVFEAPDGAGGLEHLSSTQIQLSSGVGPGAVGVLSHEFFHLWNVKRIRSKVLGPFDYTKLPQTGALWWLEGVTDYYAHLLLNRYGWFDGQEIRDQIAGNATRQRSRPGRLKVSPYEASYKVGDAAGGVGNSTGFEVNYYDTGFLLGLCLDIEILNQTKGKRSLDDVEKALWNLCKNDKPGFAEDEIRKQCVKFGGPSLGAFYDTVVMKPGELPLEDQLAKVGLKLGKVSETITDLGFVAAAERTSNGLTVRTVTADAWPELKTGDVILAINGTATDQASPREIQGAMRTATDKLGVGAAVELKIRRTVDGKPTDLTLSGKTLAGSREVTKVTDDPSATGEALRLRQIWLAKKR